jgi:hypothetical protein
MTDKTLLTNIAGCRIWPRTEIRGGRQMIVFYKSSGSKNPKPIMMVDFEHLFDGEGNWFENDLPIREVRVND